MLAELSGSSESEALVLSRASGWSPCWISMSGRRSAPRKWTFVFSAIVSGL
jgi:hypothetical protein